jgi:hypothetical protein
MAKVSGPLMSMEASGKYGGALVFGKWKGRAIVRKLVIPANPHAQGQEDARNRLRVTGLIQSFVNNTELKAPAQTVLDKDRIKAQTPAGFAWNGYLVDQMIGKGKLVYLAALAAWEALAAGEQTAWTDAAAALVPAIGEVYQTNAGGTAGTPLPGGLVFFVYQYGLSQMGLATPPGAVPPAYA